MLMENDFIYSGKEINKIIEEINLQKSIHERSCQRFNKAETYH